MIDPDAPVVVDDDGWTDVAFAPLREMLGRVVARQGGGASLCVVHRGRLVVDLAAGDHARGCLQYLYSVTKAMTAAAAAIVHEAGMLDLDAPLADCWPAMARPATRSITTRMVLGHRSGLASIDERLTLEDLLAHRDEEAIERQDPYWEPGTDHGYHGFTYGTIVNGVFRRALGQTVAQVVAERISGPLGLEDELSVGATPAMLPRIAPISLAGVGITRAQRDHYAGLGIRLTGFPRRQADGAPTTDRIDLLTGDFPATSGIASAPALAWFGAALLDDTLLPEPARTRMMAPLSRGNDRVLGIDTTFGSGVQLPFPMFPMLGSRSFGHEGAGGCVMIADPDHEVALGFTTDVYARTSGAAPGYFALLATLRHCLDAVDSA